MKNKSIVIELPNPCNEKWEEMKPQGCGRHCSTCDKTVIDFTLFSDKQLIDFFTKATGKICGHFSSWQVNRQLTYSEPQNHFLYKLLFGTTMALSLAGSANANYNPGFKPLIHKYSTSKLQKTKQPFVQLSGGNDSIKTVHIIAIDDSTKCEIPYAEVELIDKTNGTVLEAGMADINGHFTIDIPANYLSKEFSVKIWHEGYESVTINYTPGSIPENVELLLRKEQMSYLGEMNMRGGATVYIIDGIKITGETQPIEKTERIDYFWLPNDTISKMPLPPPSHISHGRWNEEL